MTPREGPPRLTQSVTTPASLRRAIKSAARAHPTQEDLERMARSLSSLRIASTPGEPAEMDADAQSGLRPVHPAMSSFMAQRPRRRMIVAGRAMAAIMAASFSVTWASVRLWRSSFGVHAPVLVHQLAEHPAPIRTAVPVARALSDVAPPAPAAAEPAPADVAAPPARPGRATPVHRSRRVSPRLEAVAAPQVQEVTPPVEAQTAAPKVSPEVQLLLEARKDLRPNPTQALRWVGEHERRFPNGTMSQEREVIAIQALRQLGRREEANERIARFRERYPSSIHGRRVDDRATGAAQQDGLEKELSGSN